MERVEMELIKAVLAEMREVRDSADEVAVDRWIEALESALRALESAAAPTPVLERLESDPRGGAAGRDYLDTGGQWLSGQELYDRFRSVRAAVDATLDEGQETPSDVQIGLVAARHRDRWGLVRKRTAHGMRWRSDARRTPAEPSLTAAAAESSPVAPAESVLDTGGQWLSADELYARFPAVRAAVASVGAGESSNWHISKAVTANAHKWGLVRKRTKGGARFRTDTRRLPAESAPAVCESPLVDTEGAWLAADELYVRFPAVRDAVDATMPLGAKPTTWHVGRTLAVRAKSWGLVKKRTCRGYRWRTDTRHSPNA
jgi:hypothetical protein